MSKRLSKGPNPKRNVLHTVLSTPNGEQGARGGEARAHLVVRALAQISELLVGVLEQAAEAGAQHDRNLQPHTISQEEVDKMSEPKTERNRSIGLAWLCQRWSQHATKLLSERCQIMMPELQKGKIYMKTCTSQQTLAQHTRLPCCSPFLA